MPIVTTSSRKRPRRNSPFSALHYALVIAVLAVVVGVVFYLRRGQTPSVPEVEAPKTEITEVKPHAVEPSKVRAEADGPATNAAPRMTPNGRRRIPVLKPLADAVQAAEAGAATNETEKAEVYTTPVMQTSEFPMATEQLLSMILSCGDTMAPPPLPIVDDGRLERHLKIALTNDIVIYETDDEKTVALKENIAEAKLQLKEIVENGGTVAAALQEYLAFIGENHRLREEVVAEYSRLVREASQEEADQYLEVANEELVAEGITPVTVQRKKRRRSSAAQ